MGDGRQGFSGGRGGDNAAGAIGTGIVKPGLVSASLGTSGVVFAFSDEVKVDKKEECTLSATRFPVNGMLWE